MERLRRIIDEHKLAFPEFQYYYRIIDVIEENIEKMPDVSIESSKALVEGMSKTILNKLKVSYRDGGDRSDTPRDLLKKVLENIPLTAPCDPEFITRTCELISRMTEIRNKRGDISHGRASPKIEASDANLAEYIAQVTEATLCYLLTIYFTADLTYLEEVKHEDNPDFNQSLDEEYPLDTMVSYSKALFDQDPIAYKEQLSEYLSYKEENEPSI